MDDRFRRDQTASNDCQVESQLIQLYAVEETIKGLLHDHRRRERQQRSKPIAAALAVWADETRRKLSRKSELAAAFRYMRARWAALVRCFDDGRLALGNNPAERALRCVAIGRKNYLFGRFVLFVRLCHSETSRPS